MLSGGGGLVRWDLWMVAGMVGRGFGKGDERGNEGGLRC